MLAFGLGLIPLAYHLSNGKKQHSDRQKDESEKIERKRQKISDHNILHALTSGLINGIRSINFAEIFERDER